MYMKSLIPVTAALLLLAACGQRNASRQTAPAAAQTAVPDMHDAENALDYQGTYTGVFPAADVPGIAVTLTLGPDGRYTEVNRYCERPGQFTDYGRYTVRGNILTLRPDSPKDIPAYFAREVLPYAPDAWIDHSKTKVGYEIPMTRYFYEYQAPEAVEDIVARITALEQDISAGLAELFHKEG